MLILGISIHKWLTEGLICNFISRTTKRKHRHVISGLISPQVDSEGFLGHFVVRKTKWKDYLYLCLEKQHESTIYLLIFRSTRQLTL
jgi:hypothetical protein